MAAPMIAAPTNTVIFHSSITDVCGCSMVALSNEGNTDPMVPPCVLEMISMNDRPLCWSCRAPTVVHQRQTAKLV